MSANTDNPLTLSEQGLLYANDLTPAALEPALGKLTAKGIDYGDIYCQKTMHESWGLEHGIVKSGTFNLDQGVGIRAVRGAESGFAYADELSSRALEEAACAARSISTHQGSGRVQIPRSVTTPARYPAQSPLDTLSASAKTRLLYDIDAYARAREPSVILVSANLSGAYDQVLVASTDGIYAADVRPLVRLNVSIVVEKNGRRESFHAGGGGRCAYQMFLEGDTWKQYVDKAIQGALRNLEARPAPAGPMPVVLGPGWPAVLLHEAVGHGLEGDFNRKEASSFARCMGEQIASPQCTVVDDGTLADRRGSLNMDDEGTPTQATTLIEDGRLVNYMQDKLNARLMGQRSTGNCRRESYAHLPMPRMTNTYMLPGDFSREQMIAETRKGIYAAHFNGGQVDITSGQFVFVMDEAWLIENGRLTTPVKGATLIGSGPQVMQNITMVGDDFALDGGIGTCGKEGQSVPVGVGQPSLKIAEITVGGTA